MDRWPRHRPRSLKQSRRLCKNSLVACTEMSELSPRHRKSKSKEQAAPPDRFKGVLLATRSCELVQRLPGFRKSKHRVPEEVTDRTQVFVGALTADRIRDDLDSVFQLLRNAFRFKRTQMKTQETSDGAGSISTPYFRYTSCVYQNPANAAEIIWQRDVSEVTSPEQILSDEFAEVFGQAFDTVEFLPPSPINLEALIDAIEEIDDPRVRLEYDRQLTKCEVYIEGIAAKLEVTSDAFRIVHPEPSHPRTLVASFTTFQDSLVDFSTFAE